MKVSSCMFCVLSFISVQIFAQEANPLFQSKEAINIRATGSVKSVKKNSNDSTLVMGKFDYQQDTSWINVPVQVRTRGNYRLANCYFPPLKLKLSKKDVDSTIFAGNKSLKLVVPCLINSEKNILIRKEYLCYQICEVLSDYHFKTRLANFHLTEISQKKPRTFELLSIFVEDNSLVAKRSNGKIIDTKGLSPQRFEEKQAIRNDFIQFLIGNVDWSALYQHNANILYSDGKYFTLAYDFDMSGFVNAGYAKINPPSMGTGDPKERIYRGFCRSKEAMEAVRAEFLSKEKAVHAVIDLEAKNFDKYDLKDMHSYIDEFFEILKSDFLFKSNILDACRTN